MSTTHLDEICDNCMKRKGYHFGKDNECPNQDLSCADGKMGYWVPMVEPIFQPIVRPGQIWGNDSPYKWCITRVEDGAVYAYRIGNDPSTAGEFGILDEYGCPYKWGRFSCEGSTAPIRNQPAASKERSDLEFFRQPSTPGYCVCGIARQQCSYHR